MGSDYVHIADERIMKLETPVMKPQGWNPHNQIASRRHHDAKDHLLTESSILPRQASDDQDLHQ